MARFVQKLSHLFSRLPLQSWMLFLAIVFVGVTSRIGLVDYPNFKPVASLALLVGFYFRRWDAVVLSVVLMMAISDFWMGSYDAPIMLAVYASLVIAGILGVVVARWIPRTELLKSALGCLAASIVMSTVFFALSNLATWFCWYSPTVTGLLECYTNALPFYRATIVSDLLFTTGWVVVFHSALLFLSVRSTQDVLAVESLMTRKP